MPVFQLANRCSEWVSLNRYERAFTSRDGVEAHEPITPLDFHGFLVPSPKADYEPPADRKRKISASAHRHRPHSARLITGRPKNHQIGTIVIPGGISELVGVHLDPGDQKNLVFPAPPGGHLRTANFRNKVWLPAVAQLANGWPELDGLRFHELRHTAASLAISSGANIKAVQRMLGHKHASMTLDRYGHLYTEDVNDLADRLDQKYRGVA